VDGVKMSKSLGNFLTIKDALRRYRPQAIRYFILTGHYRNPIDFSEAALESAARGWERLVGPVQVVRERLQSGQAPQGGDEGLLSTLAEYRTRFIAAMSDDFNAPAAIAVLFEFSRLVNTLLYPPEAGSQPGPAASRGTLEAVEALYRELAGDVLGILPAATAQGGSAQREADLIRLLIELRAQARQDKNWALSDSIRDRLAEMGIALQDGKEGTTFR
jgi:cysteinyl-tRNA synthetase